MKGHEVPGQAADPLRPHRVTLICHRGRPDLRRFERFLEFLYTRKGQSRTINGSSSSAINLEVRQQPDIGRDLMRRRTKARQRRQDVDVDLARIRLGRDGVGILEPTQFGDAFIQRLYFCVVAIKEG
jgi:hypothetical protein